MNEAMKVIAPFVAGVFVAGMLMLPEFIGYYSLLNSMEESFSIIDQYEKLSKELIGEVEKCRSNK